MAAEFQLPRLRRPRPVPKGLEAGLERLAGAWRRKQARGINLRAEAERARAAIEAFDGKRNEHLDQALRDARNAWSHRRGRSLEARVAALAAVGAVAVRELGLVPHVEQVMGVLGLERGWLLEMATGEGKTLTLAMAAVMAAWRGQPCHVLTANDYLAGRDVRVLWRFYERCGVTVASVEGEHTPAERKARYRAQVVYTTSRELVGDFLRDRLRLGRRVSSEAWRPWVRRQDGARPAVLLPRLHTVLVDEADHVLIDEAVTPLIISVRRDNDYLLELCRAALAEARDLVDGVDYEVDEARREAKVDRRITIDSAADGGHPLLRVPRWREEWLGKALVAMHAYAAGKHYVVRENKIVLIDESTGRIMPDRSLGEGLHALLEAKEGVPLSTATETLASLSFQRFFRQIPCLAGVTGTGTDAAPEFWQIYRLVVRRIPTHRPVLRRVHPLRGFRNEAAKWQHVARTVRVSRQRSQAILIGTRTVAASEALADALRAEGLPFTLLNAVRNQREAEIIAAAGGVGQVTIATNMAGRGTDIVPAEDVLAAGGLRVIATERHGSSRVDRQLFGRSGRQGQPGEVEPLACWDDEILRHHLPSWWRNWSARGGGTGVWLRFSLAVAQWRAGRQDRRRRLAVLRQDQWLDENLSLGGSNLQATEGTGSRKGFASRRLTQTGVG